jgi:CBS domain-containing protein
MASTSLATICTDAVLTVGPADPVESALRLMRERAVRRVVVAEDGDRPVGVISLGDLVRRRDPGSVLADVVNAQPQD